MRCSRLVCLHATASCCHLPSTPHAHRAKAACVSLPLVCTLTYSHSVADRTAAPPAALQAGTKEQISAAIESGIMPYLVQLLSTAEFDIKKEAAWAVSNATSGGTQEQIQYLVRRGLLPSF